MTKKYIHLDEPAEWSGHWRLPDRPDDELPGILRYDGEGNLKLELIGAFEDRILFDPTPETTVVKEGLQSWGTIHGAAAQRNITLIDCEPLKTERVYGAGVKSPGQQSITATMALIGAHVTGKDDQVFSAVQVSIEGLANWSAPSGIKTPVDIDRGALDEPCSIYVAPTKVQSVTVDDTEFCLMRHYTLSPPDQCKGEVTRRICDAVSMNVVPASPISLKSALGEVKIVQDLIALAAYSAVGVIWLRLESDESSIGDSFSACQNVDVVYLPSKIGHRHAKAHEGERLLFTCEHVSFEDVLSRWTKTHEQLLSAINMLMSLRRNPKMYVENILLTAAGAAEVLYRDLGISQRPFPVDEFKKMRAAALEHLPKKYRDHFKGVIRNEPILRERLKCLARRLDRDAVKILLADESKWAEQLASSRNQLAHTGKARKLAFEQLLVIADVTAVIIALNIMLELGVPAERQCEIVQSHPEISMVAKQGREQFSTDSKK